MDILNMENKITIFRDYGEGLLKYSYKDETHLLEIFQFKTFKIKERYSEIINLTEYEIVNIDTDDGIPTFRLDNKNDFKGSNGIQGTQGVHGNPGVGAKGAQGLKGFQGFQGIDGIEGPQGSQGFIGTQGSQGIQGLGITDTTTFAGKLKLTGVSYPRVWGSNLPIGDNDLYTVPVGKKLLVFSNYRIYNQGIGTLTTYPEIKSGGNYYRINNNISVLVNGTSLQQPNSSPIILNAGESWALNVATNNGLNGFFSAIQFDASNLLSSSKILALVNGNNTIYTVPVGKTAMILDGSTNLLNYNGSTQVINTSGGAISYTYYIVPNGGSPDATNQATNAISISNNVNQGNNISSSLNAGDSVVVNSPSAAAGQWAYVTYFEIP